MSGPTQQGDHALHLAAASAVGALAGWAAWESSPYSMRMAVPSWIGELARMVRW